MVIKDNLKGRRFGELLVLKELPEKTAGLRYYNCLCSCGKEYVVRATFLRNGKIKNCRFCRVKVCEGKKLGKLLIVGKSGKLNKNGNCYWKYRCECGFEGEILCSGLRKKTCCSICNKHNHKSLKNHKNFKGYEEITGTYWRNLKEGAKKRGFDFNISSEYAWNLFLKQDRKCSLTGMILFFPKKRYNLKEQTASLDRIDSTKGYVENNIQWIHKDINYMKRNFTESYFIDLCRKVYEDSIRTKNA